MTPFPRFLDALYQQYAGLNDGKLASYIPELAKADPN
ncbi:MAG: glutaminase A, partial [Cyanothece sp. SIO2G6]|nr:glutaminase A [Cyanothece sp. SIO2G6]